ncbi:MAG: hypothetical protein QXL18_04920 [Candidatus Woesearchaeota archaeon]
MFKKGIILLIIFLFLIVIGCKKASPPVLIEIGPTKTKVGVPFNIQPNNEAAMWFKTENATENTKIIFNGIEIRTDYKNSKLLTAPIPKEFYSKPGKYEIYLIDKKTNLKSNSLFFTVEE